MADPLTISLLVATTGMTAYSSIKQGQASQLAYDAQSKEEELRAKQVETNVAIEEAERKKRLMEALSSQNAAFGMQTGGSAQALLESGMQEEVEATNITRLGGQVESGLFRARSIASRQAGRSAYSAGLVKAGTSLLSGGIDIAKVGTTPKTGGK